ncbi:MAG: tripartite tricarboxylate transporter substrate binding protein [Reyranella sp.]|uniref:tripartite tricarboxylate transporter substrate binding protein n=1 Tax=Reyranella sp. TaxID=1929291 RepID=UPI001AD373EB|nr:tripartite tricarboxylate transporter substrate binding protein [Reyranella sp.]MBN9088001.1 tripartite tricarboxylate transporter substrate binding protein [Reyranella sp.]
MRVLAAVVTAFALVAAAGAQAQPYPDKPVRLVVPFPAGSGTDIVGRILAQKMTEDFGQTVLVDNRPGASTIVGTEIVAKSAPDGYTMVMASNNHAMNPALFEGKLPFDSIKDFASVGQVAILPFILVVNPQVPADNLAELIALAKKGGLTYASTGNGTPPHVAAEMLKRAAKVDITHVPYKGSAAAVQDVVAGQVPMMFINVPSGLSLVKAGKLRALAVGTSKRIAQMPDLPTVAELGYPGFDVSLWMGLLMPAGTPADVIDRMTKETAKALADPAVRKKVEEQGAEPAYLPPAEFSKFVVDETKRFSELVKDVGLRVDQ